MIYLGTDIEKDAAMAELQSLWRQRQKLRLRAAAKIMSRF